MVHLGCKPPSLIANPVPMSTSRRFFQVGGMPISPAATPDPTARAFGEPDFLAPEFVASVKEITRFLLRFAYIRHTGSSGLIERAPQCLL
jgi:hypothetical protein